MFSEFHKYPETPALGDVMYPLYSSGILRVKLKDIIKKTINISLLLVQFGS